jgi:shikimate kinase
MKKNIILIGFMGTGKTAVGKALKKISEFPLIDTDELIEEQANSSISNIFKLHGEEYFRNLESAVCKRLDKYSNTIISTGGGIILREENIKALKESGTVFLLTASPEEIYERTKRNKGQRPLLLVANPLQKIESLLDARNENYLKAKDHEINTVDRPVSSIASEIWEKYN